jgi:hypothetical protein
MLEPRFNSAKFRAKLSARNMHPDLIDKVISRMTELNNEIGSDTVRLGPGYQIGHSFLSQKTKT